MSAHKAAVVGAGAMGSVYGAALADAGVPTTLIDVSPEVVARISTDGIAVVRNGSEHRTKVAATSNVGAVGAVDVVVLFVKCYATEVAARSAQALIGPDTTVVSLQNGWGNGEVLASVFGPDRVVVGVSYHSATGLGPGRVAHTAAGTTFLGPYSGNDTTRADRVADLLGHGGLAVKVTPAVRSEIWKKLTLNAAALPTSALTRLVAADLGEPGPMLDLVDEIAREAVRVGQAAGHDVEEAERLSAIHAALIRAGQGKASMLQDIESDRRTEIDVINGAVARVGREHGVDTPMNCAMLALVKGLEKGLGLL
jgi:2-dehydropantoate 2-reductase